MLSQFFESSPHKTLPVRMNCGNAHKAHLWELPVRQEGSPHYGTHNKVLMLWPLFHVDDMDGPNIQFGTLVHHAIRSAIWSRASFLAYSDAVEEGVDCKFFLEERCLDTVAPIFEESRIDIDREILLFSASHLEGSPYSFVGKKLAMFADKRFAHYEWVCQSDMDFFMCCLGGESRHYPMFQKLMNQEPVMGASTFDTREAALKDVHWWQNPFMETSPEEQQAEWLHRASQLVDEDVLVPYTTGQKTILKPQGALYAFPAAHFHKHHPDRLDWLETAGKLLQDDEAVFSLYAAQWPLFAFDEEVGPVYCPRIEELHGTRVCAHRHFDGFYVFHAGSMLHKDVWHWDTGIPLRGAVTGSMLSQSKWGFS